MGWFMRGVICVICLQSLVKDRALVERHQHVGSRVTLANPLHSAEPSRSTMQLITNKSMYQASLVSASCHTQFKPRNNGISLWDLVPYGMDALSLGKAQRGAHMKCPCPW
jgi:hypothetical protein